MKFNILLIGISLVLAFSHLSVANPVIEDEGVSMSRADLMQSVRRWSPNMQQAAAEQEVARFELLSLTMASKKLAAEADKITEESDPDLYWALQMQLRALKRSFIVDRFIASIDVPDMAPLAQERYLADKDKYALVPEQRMSSHILFLCSPAACDREAVDQGKAKVIAGLAQGESFEALAAEYSDDAANKDKGGKFDRWLTADARDVAPEYTHALFELDEIGAVTEPIGSRFGLHIIRLDEIQPSYHKTFEESKEHIIEMLEAEYKQLAVEDFNLKYQLSATATLDLPAIAEILAPYSLSTAPPELETSDAVAEGASTSAVVEKPPVKSEG